MGAIRLAVIQMHADNGLGGAGRKTAIDWTGKRDREVSSRIQRRLDES
jgi:hypothetical protein